MILLDWLDRSIPKGLYLVAVRQTAFAFGENR
jgi:hypothetical protein